MFHSKSFGRIFWIDDNDEFRSCPLKLDNTGDYKYADYVSEWTDWEGVNFDLLFNIHRIAILHRQYLDNKTSNSDYILTEDVYNEVKKCYNSSNPEEVI
jgi:hypothetical protein